MIRSVFRFLPAIMLCLVLAPCGAAEMAKPFVPDLGDFMGMTQLRHFKLGYAGRTGDWPLATYEIEQIRKSFSNTLMYYPKIGDVDLTKLVETDSYGPLDALKQAAAAHDEKAFGAAFSNLTAACNACHKAAGFGFVHIVVPTASPFSNQKFGSE